MTLNIAAETVAEELLFQTGKAILEKRDDLFLECIRLPVSLETSNGARLITSAEQVRVILSDLRRYMHNEGYVDFARTVVEAEFLDSETIGSTHVSVMICENGTTKRCPYPVYSIIRRIGRQWRMVSSLYAILDCERHNNALLSKISSDEIMLGKDR